MILAESIGFAGTHSISSILKGIKGTHVAHGSRNFALQSRLDDCPVPAKEFLEQMVAKNAEGKACFAVHSLYDPQELKKLSRKFPVKIKGIVRDPLKQVNSCYSWAWKKVLDGDDGVYQTGNFLMNSFCNPDKSIKRNASNAIYIFALHHVMTFNIKLLQSRFSLAKMEDLLSDKQAFCEFFELDNNIALPHFDSQSEERQASHSGKLKDMGIKDPDRNYLNGLVKAQVSGISYNVHKLADELGYPSK